MTALLADEFVHIGATGRITADKKQIVEGLARTNFVGRLSLSDFEAKRLAPDVVLTTYRGVIFDETGQPTKHTLCSSIWKHMAGRWQTVFHQETPTAAPDK